MATVWSGYTSTGTYTKNRVKVDYSGTSATATLCYTRTNTYSGATGGTGTFTFAGKSVSYNKTFSGKQTDAAVASVTFTIPTSGGTYSGSSTSAGGYLNWSGSVTIPSQGTLPAKPSCTASTVSASSLQIVWGTTNLGDPAGTVTLYRGTTSSPTTVMYSRNVTGNVTFVNDQLAANTQYYYKATAINSLGSVNSDVTSAITKPAGITSIATSNITATSAQISVTCASSGSAETTYLQMSTDGTTWTTYSNIPDVHGRTISTSASNLTPDTQYTRYYRVHTSVGNSAVSSVTFRTLATSHLYGSVGGQTKRIDKLYGSVGGQTKKIKKLYGSVNGQTKLIYTE